MLPCKTVSFSALVRESKYALRRFSSSRINDSNNPDEEENAVSYNRDRSQYRYSAERQYEGDKVKSLDRLVRLAHDSNLRDYLMKKPIPLKQLQKADSNIGWFDFINRVESEDTLTEEEINQNNRKRLGLLIDKIKQGIRDTPSLSLFHYLKTGFQEYYNDHVINHDRFVHTLKYSENTGTLLSREIAFAKSSGGFTNQRALLPKSESISVVLQRILRRITTEKWKDELINEALIIYLNSSDSYNNTSSVKRLTIAKLLYTLSMDSVLKSSFHHLSSNSNNANGEITLKLMISFYKDIIKSDFLAKVSDYSVMGFLIYCYSNGNIAQFEKYCSDMQLVKSPKCILGTYSFILKKIDMGDTKAVSALIQSLARLAPNIKLDRSFVQILICHYASTNEFPKLLNAIDLLTEEYQMHLDELTFLYLTQAMCKEHYYTAFKDLSLFLLERYEIAESNGELRDLENHFKFGRKMRSVSTIDRYLKKQPVILYEMHSIIELVFISYIKSLVDLKFKSNVICLEIQSVVELLSSYDFYIPLDIVKALRRDIALVPQYPEGLEQSLDNIRSVNWGFMKMQFNGMPVIDGYQFVMVNRYFEKLKKSWDTTFKVAGFLTPNTVSLEVTYTRKLTNMFLKLRSEGKLHQLPGRYLRNERATLKHCSRQAFKFKGPLFGFGSNELFEDGDFDNPGTKY